MSGFPDVNFSFFLVSAPEYSVRRRFLLRSFVVVFFFLILVIWIGRWGLRNKIGFANFGEANVH
jgi:hypothetical protein